VNQAHGYLSGNRVTSPMSVPAAIVSPQQSLKTGSNATAVGSLIVTAGQLRPNRAKTYEVNVKERKIILTEHLLNIWKPGASRSKDISE